MKTSKMTNSICTAEKTAAATPQGHQPHMVVRAHHQGGTQTECDQVAIEVPVALEYNGINHAVMLVTPTDLEDMAYGFSYTEGIIRSAQDIYDVEIIIKNDGIILQIEIASACLQQMKLRRRQLAGRTGCGLCGIESLTEVRRPLAPIPRPIPPLSYESMLLAARNLFHEQSLHHVTGATHAAGWTDRNGTIHGIREDVGRHNALDKLIGHLLRQDIDASAGIAIISSRASFEMVQKTAAAGIPVLAAVSAPTSYAIQVAQELNLLLAGFVRESHLTIYTHPEHLAHPGDHHA